MFNPCDLWRGHLRKGAGKDSSKGHDEKGGGKDSSKGKGDVDQEDKGKGRGSIDSSKGAEKLFCHWIGLIFFLLRLGRKGSMRAVFCYKGPIRFSRGSVAV